ncbi:SRPBCC family protein [Gordonia zhaorongruii]|uniref:SRPBCC family protein n=1 Tax=Gordonia zhaorongruii TaxID=2597659 RepID=UPI001051ECA7|nr:SRPBCC family protein [Gordonia zhaorongruii]
MTSIHREAETAVPREKVFAYVNDHTTVPKWMFGITSFEPTTDQVEGVGATFESVMRVGPKTFTSTMKVTEWVRDEVIAMTSIAGTDVQTAWRFADGSDPGSTRLTVDFDYQLPGGLAGRALSAIVEPVVGQAIRHTEQSLLAQVASAV